MKKTKDQLLAVKNFVDSIYSSSSNPLLVDIKDKDELDLEKPLGYCYKLVDDVSGREVYNIVCSETGLEDTDLRVLIHEYGHIYFGHLDNSYSDLDKKANEVFEFDRLEIEEELNRTLGIDYAGKLIDRVIDDPALNHSIHNIAMDMEINSKILSLEDIEEMEADITSLYPNQLDILDPDKKMDKEIRDVLEKAMNQNKIKLIHPSRYHFPDGTPFPDELQYYDYFLLIIQNLDQFVKMMISISLGGSGDTSEVSEEDLKNALNGNGEGGGNGEGNDGDSSGSGTGIDTLLGKMGIGGDDKEDADQSEGDGDKGKGKDKDKDSKSPSDSKEKGDHDSPEREKADKERELGLIRNPGNNSRSESGGSLGIRQVNKTVDSLEMAINKIFKGYCKKVVKIKNRKDTLYLYNRGINTSVIAPTIKRRVTTDLEPTIVYLIDISGSMDTHLIDRVLVTIAQKMKKINSSLRYNIITWDTGLGEHMRDIKAGEVIPKIHVGGGTRLAGGIRYFRENYDRNATLIIISDFEDSLYEWKNEESKLSGYTLFGLNYGRSVQTDFNVIKVIECSANY